jgi:hypothetical protein
MHTKQKSTGRHSESGALQAQGIQSCMVKLGTPRRGHAHASTEGAVGSGKDMDSRFIHKTREPPIVFDRLVNLP